MKFFRVCAAVLAISGVVYNSVYGMDEPLERQGDARGAFNALETNSQIIGVVRATLTMVVEGAEERGAGKVINLYTEGGVKTQDHERTLKFTVKNVGTNYKITFAGEQGLSNENCNGHNWAVKAQNNNSKIGVDLYFLPAGGEAVKVENAGSLEFQGGWKSGDWSVVVEPQDLTPNTIIDTYTGVLHVKIEANN